jgi:hypothetical protein
MPDSKILQNFFKFRHHSIFSKIGVLPNWFYPVSNSGGLCPKKIAKILDFSRSRTSGIFYSEKQSRRNYPISDIQDCGTSRATVPGLKNFP